MTTITINIKTLLSFVVIVSIKQTFCFILFTEILLKKYASKNLSDSDSEDGSMLQFTQIELEEQHLTQPVVEEHSASSKGSSVWGSCYVVMASIMASLGGILFGYDIG